MASRDSIFPKMIRERGVLLVAGVLSHVSYAAAYLAVALGYCTEAPLFGERIEGIDTTGQRSAD